MSTLRVDEITNIEDSGPVEFKRGLNVNGTPLDNLIDDAKTVVSETAPDKAAGAMWFNTVDAKTYTKHTSGAWIELKSPDSPNGNIEAWDFITDLPNTPPADQTYALFGDRQHVYKYSSSKNTWVYAGKPSYTWTGSAGQPTFTSLVGGTSNISGSYTPPSGCTSFHIMVWGSSGYGGQPTAYSNLQRVSPYESVGGRAYAERLVPHNGSSSYAYTLGSAASLYATGGSGSGFRSYAGTTTFNWGGGTISCTGTGNPSRTGGVASGGSFNANGATANVSGSGGGSGSRTGDGNVDGSNGGLVEAAGVVPITFRGFRGFQFNPSPAKNYINKTGSVMGNYGSNGKPYYAAATGESALSSHEQAFSNALRWGDEGTKPQNTYGRGTESHILILEYYD